MALQRNLPLYAQSSLHDEHQPFCQRAFINHAHTGLLFDKYVDTWGTSFVIQEPNGDKPGSKRCFYDEILAFYKNQQKTLSERLTAHHERRAILLQASHGKTLTAKTDWRFISGLGTEHPFEAGFIWHRTLSVPYLPGSSVKGMVRAWASQWDDVEETTVTRLFGPVGEQARKRPDTGSLITFDALPVQAPKLELDIMNPHYGPYYKDSSVPPADYHSPVPVFFIAVVEKNAFQFAVAPRCPGDPKGKDDVETGLKLLREALETLGSGGKTAVGYGRMVNARIENPSATPQECIQAEVLRWTLDELAIGIGKNWNKTKGQFPVSEDTLIPILREVLCETMHAWKDSTNKNQKKAYRRLFGGGHAEE